MKSLEKMLYQLYATQLPCEQAIHVNCKLQRPVHHCGLASTAGINGYLLKLMICRQIGCSLV